MKEPKNKLYIPEWHGAILYDSGKYELFFAKYHEDDKSWKAKIKKIGNNTKTLYTDGIILCAWVLFQNLNNVVLIHAQGKANLLQLLIPICNLSRENAKQEPKKIHLCTANPYAIVKDDRRTTYKSVMSDILGKSIKIQEHSISESKQIFIRKDVVYTWDE